MDGTPFGHYRLLHLLGEGGMGQVYRAFDTLTHRTVALKVLPERMARDPSFRLRFLREAHLAAGLTEPHVVPIHRFGEIDGQLYVDMRLIDGRDLQADLSSVGAMEPARVAAILVQIASALDAAHMSGLVHRDVKPSNILLTGNDFAYLIDFGIARGEDQTALTSVGSTIGTLAYMAPERFKTGEADQRSDVYSLACVLYECLTGHLAFPGTSLEQQLAAHLMGPPPKPTAIRPSLPAAVDLVVQKGLAKEPVERYQTCTELMQAFESAVSVATGNRERDQPAPEADNAHLRAAWAPTQHRVATGQKISKTPRNFRPAPLVAVALAVLVTVTGVVLFTNRRSESAGPNTASALNAGSRPAPKVSGTAGSVAGVARVDALAATLPAGILASGKLVIGVNVPYTPNEFRDTSGKIIGFDVDLMNAIAGTLGLTPVYIEADFARIIPSVQSGVFDVGMSSFTDTKGREAVVDLVTYYSAGTLWAKRPGADTGPSDACGRRVAVQTTTIQETDDLPARSKVCTDNGEQAISILRYDGQDQATNAVILGQADAMLADSPVAAYAIKQSQGQLEVAGDLYDEAPYGWPVAKDSSLAQSLLQALEHLIGSGVYEQVATDWGLELGMIDRPVVNGGVS